MTSVTSGQPYSLEIHECDEIASISTDPTSHRRHDGFELKERRGVFYRYLHTYDVQPKPGRSEKGEVII